MGRADKLPWSKVNLYDTSVTLPAVTTRGVSDDI